MYTRRNHQQTTIDITTKFGNSVSVRLSIDMGGMENISSQPNVHRAHVDGWGSWRFSYSRRLQYLQAWQRLI